MTFCSCLNNQKAVAVVATMANCSLIVLAMAIFCSKVETCKDLSGHFNGNIRSLDGRVPSMLCGCCLRFGVL